MKRTELTDNVSLLVGIGASAGGTHALSLFLKALPARTGFCFVVVTHSAPDFDHVLCELLERHTPLAVTLVTEGTLPQPNTVLVAPAGQLVELDGGHLRLRGRRESVLPIDHLLSSLGQLGTQAAAVILSGGGSDGSQGARDLARRGGHVLVQNPASAEFPSMPKAALSAVPTARAMEPDDMPAALVALCRPDPETGGGPDDWSPGEQDILIMLRNRYGLDFREYRTGTVLRRIRRRIGMREKEGDSGNYQQCLERDPHELDALYRDLLIGVTEFFRDRPVFELLAREAIGPLVRSRKGEEIRAWVAGCATGEEAYSLAILFEEAAREAAVPLRLSLFATDMHGGSLEQAGEGVYPAEHLASVDRRLCETYFLDLGSGEYRVRPELRRSIVFARHDLLSDPPFAKLDLVSCRNVLIYLRPSAQERALREMGSGLKLGGVLLLGSSEGIGPLGDCFSPLSAEERIFRKDAELPLLRRGAASPHIYQAGRRVASGSQLTISKNLLQAYDAIFDRLVGDGVLVDEALEIRQFFGNGADYLLPERGRQSGSLLERTSGDLRLAVSVLVPRAVSRGLTTRARGIVTPRQLADGLLQPGRYVRMSVADSGQGIAPEVLERLFDPFFTTKAPGRGTGLGLSIVHGIVKSHEGGIDVSSSQGQGTIFSIFLPLGEESEAGLASDSVLRETPRGQGETVLVVDDVESVAKMTARHLTALGYRASYVLDPVEAQQVLVSSPSPYDLLISDITMPRITGIELVRELRARGIAVPVVLISGRLDDQQEATALGHVELLVKPFTRHDLAVRIDRLLRSRSLQPASGLPPAANPE